MGGSDIHPVIAFLGIITVVPFVLYMLTECACQMTMRCMYSSFSPPVPSMLSSTSWFLVL